MVLNVICIIADERANGSNACYCGAQYNMLHFLLHYRHFDINNRNEIECCVRTIYQIYFYQHIMDGKHRALDLMPNNKNISCFDDADDSS